jgi:16S rRNA (guanine(966)-N(2))-methyltransferase RsmD
MTGYIDFEGTEALDLFAGTGSITLELLSRGCKEVVSVEMDRDHARFIQQCIDKVGAENHTLVKGDAFRFMKSCKRQFDFIFADPPYSLPTLETIPDLALPLLKEGGMMVFEHGKQNDFSQHPRFVERRVYGAVNFSLFR